MMTPNHRRTLKTATTSEVVCSRPARHPAWVAGRLLFGFMDLDCAPNRPDMSGQGCRQDLSRRSAPSARSWVRADRPIAAGAITWARSCHEQIDFVASQLGDAGKLVDTQD